MKTLITIAALALTACSPSATVQAQTTPPVNVESENTDSAILAGGCFWCMESDFEKLPGVIEAVSGYTGGDMASPTYRNHGRHVEAVKITFDPTVISYPALLDYYWHHIDPTDDSGQFCDKGHAYIPVIYARDNQTEQAEASKQDIILNKPFSQTITVPVLPAKTFWNAEDYHQDYYKKNPRKYKFYRKGCRRDARVEQLWGK